MFKILVVEDDRELNRAVCAFLGRNGYEAVGCLCAEEAYDALYETVFDLIISDIMMPGTDGFEFARTVREQNTELPILFMTARDDLTAKQRGFSAGADDYMVKPVDLDELLLRIGALLRRAKIASSKRLTAGSLLLDADEHTAYLSGAEVPLTVREFDLLYKLLSTRKRPSPAHSLWRNSGKWKHPPARALWMYISPSCGTNFPPARILRSSPCTGWAIRRC